METTSQITAQETATIRNHARIHEAREALNRAITCGRDLTELERWRLAYMLGAARRALAMLDDIEEVDA